MAGKKTPSRKRNRESSRAEPTKGPIPKKEKVEESPRVKYKTVPCKKYWTVGQCELGPRCVYIHQVWGVSRLRFGYLHPPYQKQWRLFFPRRLVMPWQSRSSPTTANFHLLRLSPSRLRSQSQELTVMFKVEQRLAVDMLGSAVMLQPPRRPGEQEPECISGKLEQSMMGILALAASARNGRPTTSNLSFSTWWPLLM